jgi:hypothetical protein
MPSTCLQFIQSIKNAFIESHFTIDAGHLLPLLAMFLLLTRQQAGGQHFEFRLNFDLDARLPTACISQQPRMHSAHRVGNERLSLHFESNANLVLYSDCGSVVLTVIHHFKTIGLDLFISSSTS